MQDIDETLIRRMQDNLAPIRKVAGWTTRDLGSLMGVSAQTISLIERHQRVLTKTQYLALRMVLTYEIVGSDNETLGRVVQALVDNPIIDEIEDDSSELARSTEQSADSERVKELAKLVGTSAMAAAAAMGSSVLWPSILMMGLLGLSKQQKD